MSRLVEDGEMHALWCNLLAHFRSYLFYLSIICLKTSEQNGYLHREGVGGWGPLGGFRTDEAAAWSGESIPLTGMCFPISLRCSFSGRNPIVRLSTEIKCKSKRHLLLNRMRGLEARCATRGFTSTGKAGEET